MAALPKKRLNMAEGEVSRRKVVRSEHFEAWRSSLAEVVPMRVVESERVLCRGILLRQRIAMLQRSLATLLSMVVLDFLLSVGAYGQVPPVAERPDVSSEETRAPLERTLAAPETAPSVIDLWTPAGPLGQWLPQGPGPALNGQVENIPGMNPVTGGVHAIIIAHPTNANILFLGGVNGGVWRTTNATAANPSWTSLTDQFPSLSIGALELDPIDPSNQTLVAGIGRYSNFGLRGGPLTGLLRTTDGGNTWTQLGQAALAGRNVSSVGPRGNTILVAVNSGSGPGMYRSTDGGATFPFISGTNGLNAGLVFDMVGDPGNPNRFYAGVGGVNGGVFRTDDAGSNWTDVTDATIGGLVGGATNNIEVAVHNNAGAGTNAVYVAICNAGRLAGVLRSPNIGGTWTAMDLPQTNEGGVAFGIHPGGQCGTNLSIAADPTNANIVYVGGDRQPRPGPDGIEGTADDAFPNSIGANDFSGRLFRGNASIAPTGGVPSPQWTPLTHSGTTSNSSPHADSREMVFDANGNIIQGDDGGIYRRTNPTSNAGNWQSVIGNLQVTEFHDIAYDRISHIIIGGTQDTGTPEQITPGGTTWRSVSTADGGDVAVDHITLAAMNQSIRYSSFQNLGQFRRRVLDAANNQIGATVFPALTVVGGGAALVSQFKTPVELNAINPTRLIIGGANSTYESLDQGATIMEVGPGIGVNREHAIAYGGRSGGVDNPDVLYVGSGTQVFVRTTAGGALNATAPLPAGVGTVRDIALDTDDWMTAFVVDNNQVFVTNNAGATWTDITGNLSDVDLQAVEFIPATSRAVVVGGQGGVFLMRTNNPGVWEKLGKGLPNAPVFELDYDHADDVLVAGTLGRGAWLLPNVSGEADLSIVMTDSPDPVKVGGELTYRLRVRNLGPSNATDVIVTDTLPANVNFVSASSGCSRSGSIVTCEIGNMSDGESAVRLIRVRPTAPGGFSNTATVTANETDPDPTNNTVTTVTTVK
jgi:uncharacterized repeat protein (TIGR01451 family)